MSTIDPQEFGYLKAKVGTLVESEAKNSELLEKLAEDMYAVRLQLAEARGGWKLLVALGGCAGSIGAGITWVLTHWKGTP